MLFDIPAFLINTITDVAATIITTMPLNSAQKLGNHPYSGNDYFAIYNHRIDLPVVIKTVAKYRKFGLAKVYRLDKSQRYTGQKLILTDASSGQTAPALQLNSKSVLIDTNRRHLLFG